VANVVAPIIVGFCIVEVKLFGPLQLYVDEPIVLAVKLILLPEHKVVFADAIGEAGVGLTNTDTVPFGPAQPATVAFTE
jgi:hypothetical protein